MMPPLHSSSPAARQAANTQRNVQTERAGGNDLHFLGHRAIGHTHDRALAELLFYLRQRR
mgnify:CR=1 FL=1